MGSVLEVEKRLSVSVRDEERKMKNKKQVQEKGFGFQGMSIFTVYKQGMWMLRVMALKHLV